MPKQLQVINPAVEKNITLVTSLMKSEQGDEPGILEAYKTYSLSAANGEVSFYTLTFSVFQFVNRDESRPGIPEIRLDVVEPHPTAQGNFGTILTVVKSILFKSNQPYFDNTSPYLVKQIIVDSERVSDKLNKPNPHLRAAFREHFLASQLPHLGVDYQPIHTNNFVYLHMNRVPGFPLNYYFHKLNARQFLQLSIALLEQIPPQLHKIVSKGKHQGNTIVHCDLKPANVIAHESKNGEWTVGVVDLGLAKARKEGEVLTNLSRGNKMVFDSVLLNSSLKNLPFKYNKQSDLYAIYVCIMLLGGALYRTEIAKEQQLLSDLKNPNLRGLFATMDFTESELNVLTTLIRNMIVDNRNERVSRENALKTLRSVLVTYQTKNTQHVVEIPPSLVTAETIKDCLEEHLEMIIQDNQQTEKSNQFQTIQSWVQRCRERHSRLDDTEKKRYELMVRNKEITIVSQYIYHFIRSGLIDEYDDVACTRLLLRHHEIIKPIHSFYPLSKEWQARFDKLGTHISLQLADDHQRLCDNIVLFKKNASTILSMSITKESPDLLVILQTMLTDQLKMDFNSWLDNLPTLTQRFNDFFYCLAQLALLKRRIIPILDLIANFDDTFDDWIDATAAMVIDGRYSANVRAYLDLFYDLIDELLLYKKDLPLIEKIIKTHLLEEDPLFDLKQLRNEIHNIDFKNNDQVIKLMLKLSPITTMAAVYKKLIAENSFLYFQVKAVGKAQFSALLKEDLDPLVLSSELNRLSGYLDDAVYLERIAKDYFSLYPNVIGGLHYLVTNPISVIKLCDMIETEGQSLINLDRLDTAIETMLQKENKPEIHDLLLGEFTRYCADPKRYKAPMSVAANPYKFLSKSIIQTQRPIADSCKAPEESAVDLQL